MGVKNLEYALTIGLIVTNLIVQYVEKNVVIVGLIHLLVATSLIFLLKVVREYFGKRTMYFGSPLIELPYDPEDRSVMLQRKLMLAIFLILVSVISVALVLDKGISNSPHAIHLVTA